MSSERENNTQEEKMQEGASLELVSDLIFVIVAVPILLHVGEGGMVDAIYGYGYVAVLLLYRSYWLRRPMGRVGLLLHVALTISLINSFDKIVGYPHDRHEPVLWLGTATVFWLSIRYAYRFRRWLPLLAPVLIYTQAFVVPLEIARNAVAREVYEEIPSIYVTKLVGPHIYGVSLHNPAHVFRFTNSDGTYKNDFHTCDIDKMNHIEYANLPRFAYEIVGALYKRGGNQKQELQAIEALCG